MTNQLKATLIGLLLIVVSTAAFAQYPTVPPDVQAEAAQKGAEVNRHSNEAWAKALPVIEEWEKKGKPYIPWADDPKDLPQATIPAFPGAEGGGAYSFGGRGGKVMVVTSLEDSGPGTFREALEAGGPRIVVFNVAGIIKLKTKIRVRAPYITINGASAPGDGVCIAGDTVELENHDVIVRYMRFRRGNTWVGDRNDSFGGNPVGNVMIDHVSASWGSDECMSMYRHMYNPPGTRVEEKLPTVNITIQNSIFSEALNTYSHAFGSTIGGYNSTFHHNLWACNGGRNPSVGMNGDFGFVNNVLFNWVGRTVDGGDHLSYYSVINCYLKPGPATPNEPIAYRLLKPESERSKTVIDHFGHAYVAGNIVEGNERVTKDNWDGGVQPEPQKAKVEDVLKEVRSDKPFPMAKLTVMPADKAYEYVLANAGAMLPKRDPVDVRVIEMVRTGKVSTKVPPDIAEQLEKLHSQPSLREKIIELIPKGIITDPAQVGGYPEYKGTPYKDSDSDGMPDEYESAHGLNPNDASDASKDSGDGYTNIEKYLNGLAGQNWRMIIELNGFALELSLLASKDGGWLSLPLTTTDRGLVADHKGLHAELVLDDPLEGRIDFGLRFTSPFRTRVRLRAALRSQHNLFHLIPGNIHGDNNAAHVRPGEFPCLTTARPHEQNCFWQWEFRADRSSHPVSILCCAAGAVGISIDPYSDSDETDDRFIRNGVFAELPDAFGVSLGYGNVPLTFSEKTSFWPATADLVHKAEARGTIFACRGEGRLDAHRILRALHQKLRDVPKFNRTHRDALRALADAFATVNYSPELGQYTNRKCRVPVDTKLTPWRAIVEIGWTGGSMLAYPFALAERIFPDLKMPKGSSQIFDEICSGFNEASGFINDTCINHFTKNRPAGWNDSTVNGWWSGFLPQTRDNHCAYTNAHAAYYILRENQAPLPVPGERAESARVQTALRVLDTAMSLQREDGAFGYIFSSTERKVIDWEGFAGSWFAAALPLAWKITGNQHYRESATRALNYYWPFVRALSCWGSPMDTFKSVDSEGNLAFIRAARLMHQFTGEPQYLRMLEDGAHYEYLWRYAFRTRPQCPPLRGSSWNSCGGSITSVSNPHIHPMSVVATNDLQYLARISKDSYHAARAEDGLAWLMNTMELYPDVTGYGQYGVLSERTCPSDGLLAEVFYDDNSPSSTWWSYNAWAAGSAMEALAEQILSSNEIR